MLEPAGEGLPRVSAEFQGGEAVCTPSPKLGRARFWCLEVRDRCEVPGGRGFCQEQPAHASEPPRDDADLPETRSPGDP